MATIAELMPPDTLGADPNADPNAQAEGQQGPPPPGTTEEPGYSGQTPATDEEQAAYERVVLAGVDALSKDPTHGRILKILKSGSDNPPKAIADATVMIVLGLDQASGNTLPEKIIMGAAAGIAEKVAELAAAAGMPVDQTVLDKTSMFLIDGIAKAYGTSAEQVQQLMGQYPDDQIETARSQMDAVANPDKQPMPRDAQGAPVPPGSEQAAPPPDAGGGLVAAQMQGGQAA